MTSNRRIAVLGDVHGCLDEFQRLLDNLAHESLDEIWHVGDLLDRGPDSGAVVQLCVERRIRGVMGNHESTVLKRRARILAGIKHKSVTEKDRTIASIRAEDWSYLENLPRFQVFDDLNTVVVHGGLLPRVPLHEQPFSVCFMQMIKPWAKDGVTRWWGDDKIHGCSEQENRAKGWVRWYEINDYPGLVVYGHSVFQKPHLFNNTAGIDTGCVFGGELTALIIPDMKFVSVPAKRVYFETSKKAN